MPMAALRYFPRLRLLFYLLFGIFFQPYPEIPLGSAVGDVRTCEKGVCAMVMKTGERWRCTNAACRCTVLVETTGEAEGENPRCACGSLMKKEYSSPVFQYLDFLYLPEPAPARHNSSEE